MAQILVRNIEDGVKEKLRRRAHEHGRSTEEEVREILRNAVRDEPGRSVGLGTWIAAQFADLGLKAGEIQELRGHPVSPAEFKP